MTEGANLDCGRFLEAESYAGYLDTPEGRLRSTLAFENVQEFLPHVRRQLRALDVGSGTGALAIRLAGLGVHVTLLDSSPAMLEAAGRTAREAGTGDRIVLRQGDAARVGDIFSGQSFDLILCHHLLEFVDDPGAVLRELAKLMTDSAAVLSLLVRMQAGEVLKAAIRAGDLSAAERNLTAEWGHESLYGGRVRLFTPDGVGGMLMEASLIVTATRGIRVVVDYLPTAVSRTEAHQQILELERKLGKRPEFAAVARYAHYLVRHA